MGYEEENGIVVVRLKEGSCTSFFVSATIDSGEKSNERMNISMKFVSWNVNGLRAIMKKNFPEVLVALNPDFFCIQEIKLQEGQIELDFEEYEEHWHYAERKGYSGTAILAKHTPLNVIHGTGTEGFNDEGRVLTLEFDHFYLTTCYSPNSQSELKRIDYRVAWEKQFQEFLTGLKEKKPVIVCGDLNVAHHDIDLKNPENNHGSAGFSDEERHCFEQLLSHGFTDTYRYFYPEAEGKYTWWNYRFNARKRNAGWRIDYFLVSNDLLPYLKNAVIYDEIMGSDHCPVGIELDDSLFKSTP